MAALGDLGTEPFEVVRFEVVPLESVPGSELPVTAPDGRWAVLIGESGPLSALRPGRTLAVGTRPPGILVAAAGLDQATAFSSAAFREPGEISALVLTDAGAGPDGEPRVTGLVSSEALTRALLRGPVRGITGPVLPGAAAIPLISRSCGFTERRSACATAVTFVFRPSPMPPCPNGHALTAHSFVW
jgi:hypothetical protein